MEWGCNTAEEVSRAVGVDTLAAPVVVVVAAPAVELSESGAVGVAGTAVGEA